MPSFVHENGICEIWVLFCYWFHTEKWRYVSYTVKYDISLKYILILSFIYSLISQVVACEQHFFVKFHPPHKPPYVQATLLIIQGEEHKVWNSPLCNFFHSSVHIIYFHHFFFSTFSHCLQSEKTLGRIVFLLSSSSSTLFGSN